MNWSNGVTAQSLPVHAGPARSLEGQSLASASPWSLFFFSSLTMLTIRSNKADGLSIGPRYGDRELDIERKRKGREVKKKKW